MTMQERMKFPAVSGYDPTKSRAMTARLFLLQENFGKEQPDYAKRLLPASLRICVQ
ncbi:hypothetical protein [Desulfovibrio piger]|uniref:hypothetical protein n=1 Tax=Desulfovibrio piger TaxID=901 RepID=UPI0026F2AA4E|nr:hypothetical protein [Desulfovibrio piger]